jgi:hypothetical protein
LVAVDLSHSLEEKIMAFEVPRSVTKNMDDARKSQALLVARASQRPSTWSNDQKEELYLIVDMIQKTFNALNELINANS